MGRREQDTRLASPYRPSPGLKCRQLKSQVTPGSLSLRAQQPSGVQDRGRALTPKSVSLLSKLYCKSRFQRIETSTRTSSLGARSPRPGPLPPLLRQRWGWQSWEHCAQSWEHCLQSSSPSGRSPGLGSLWEEVTVLLAGRPCRARCCTNLFPGPVLNIDY